VWVFRQGRCLNYAGEPGLYFYYVLGLVLPDFLGQRVNCYHAIWSMFVTGFFLRSSISHEVVTKVLGVVFLLYKPCAYPIDYNWIFWVENE